ncbi:TerC family protein [Bradyrhizobium sp. PMVTL-01]|uniref:TerC family protein n=1 Tax=Bradyrhizobium sp. PMVTL-01 TaxID=3434999 RepID=UPI003F7264AD
MFEQLQAEIAQPIFWLSFSKIVWINILLSGDNALVIAMVCRGLVPRQRLLGMIFGAGAAILLRVVLTGAAAALLDAPYLKMAGGAALFFVAVKLLAPPKEGDHVKQATGLMAAVGIILMADLTMSLDNVIAVAAAAEGNMTLLVLGLAMSIPLIVAGASLIVAMIDRLPVLVWAGAALLGWISGELMVADPALAAYTHLANAATMVAAVAAGLTLATGAVWRITADDAARASS